MLEALTPSRDLLTSHLLLLEQLQQWAGRVATPLTLLFASAILGSVLKWSRRHLQTPGPLPPSPGTALPLLGHLHIMKGVDDPRVTFSGMR